MVLHAADEHGGRSSWPRTIRPPAEDAPPSSVGGGMFLEGYPAGRPRALSGGGVFSALKPIAGGAAFILGLQFDAAG